MSGEYKFYVRNSDNTVWVNILKDSQVEIDSDGAAGGQFAGEYLDEVLLELKSLAGGGAPGYAGTPIHILNTDDVTDSSDDTGSFSTTGGMAVAQSLFVGGHLTTETTSDFDGIATFNSSINIATDITSVQNVTGDGTGSVSGFVNLVATGDVNSDTLTLSGLATVDTLSILTSVDSNVVPAGDGTQFLGSPTKKWNTVYVGTISADVVNSTAFTGVFTGTLNGNVVGDVSGNLVGNVDGNLIASPTVTVTSNQGSTSPTTGALVVEGGLGVAENVFIGGNVDITGTLSAAGLDIGFDAIGESMIPSTDNTYDLGENTTPYRWKDAYFAGTVYGNITGNVTGDLDGDLVKTSTVNVTNATGSTSSTTGALVVAGGVGIDENLYVGQNVTIAGSLNVAGSYTPSSVSTAQMFVTGIIASTDKDTGALIVTNGGLGVEGNVNLGGNIGILGSGTIGTTFGVTGATTLSSTLQVDGAVDINNAVDVDITGGNFDVLTDGSIILNGNVVDIDTTLDVTVDTPANIIITSDEFNVTVSQSTLTGSFIFNNTAIVTETFTANGDVNIGSDNTDTVTFNSKITGPLVPSDGSQDIGLTGESWNIAYINKMETRGGVSTTDNATGDIISIGGIATQDNLWVDGTATIGGITAITDTTQSTVSTDGALVVAGGVGIAKDLHVGGNVYSNTLTATTFIGNLNGNVTGSLVGTSVTADLIGDLVKATTVQVTNNTPAPTYGTGALVIANGVVGPTLGSGLTVEGNTWIGGNLVLPTVGTDITLPSGRTLEDELDARTVENGFVDRTESTISFDNGLMRFSIQPTVTEFVFYAGGVGFSSTGDTVDITDTEGLWYFYYVGDVLTASQTFTDDIIVRHAFVAAVYWSVPQSAALTLADERHGNTMSSTTHSYLHNTQGSKLAGGGALSFADLTLADGTADTDVQIAVADFVTYDEDIRRDSQDYSQVLTSPAELPVWYQEWDGTLGQNVWKKQTTGTIPLIKTGTGGEDRVAYNQRVGGQYQLTEITDQYYMAVHIVATNDTNEPVVAIVGTAEYATLNAAYEGGADEAGAIEFGDIASLTPEWVFLGTAILLSDETYTNTYKARFVQDVEGNDYIDLRGSALSPSGGTTADDHAGLTNLQGGTIGSHYHSDQMINVSSVPRWAGINIDWQVATDALTLTAGQRFLVNNTVFTLSLPGAPVAGQSIHLSDVDGTWGTTPVTLDSNGTQVEGAVQDIILNVPGASLELIYSGDTYGWKII